MEENIVKITKRDETEKSNLREIIRAFKYPLTPKKNNNLRNEPQVSIISNLFPIEYTDSIHKIFLYSIEILPTISDDNFPLKRVVFQKIEDLLPEEFKKNIFAGNNLYSCMANYNNKDMSYFEYSATVKNENYKVKLNKVKTIDFTEINNNGEKENQEIKHIIEKLIRMIRLKVYLASS